METACQTAVRLSRRGGVKASRLGSQTVTTVTDPEFKLAPSLEWKTQPYHYLRLSKLAVFTQVAL